MYFILVTVALDMMGAGLLIPVLPQFIATLTGQDLAHAAQYGGALAALFAVIQFLAAPVLGNLSDHFGRRPVLLVSLAAFGLNYLLMAYAPTLAWLFVAQGFAGLFGATTATAGAYLADVTPPAERAHRFGMLGGAVGVGIIIGPFLGGVLGEHGMRLPFLAAAGITLLNFCYGLWVLPESLPPERRRPFALHRAHVLGAFRSLAPLPFVTGVLGAYLLAQLALQSIPATWPYYAMQRFGWGARDVGLSVGLYGAMSILGQGLLVARLSRRFGSRVTAGFGLLMAITGFVGLALSGSGAIAIAFILPSALGYMTGPSLNGLMSSLVPSDRQGELQGAIASLTSGAMIVAPPVMTLLYSHFVRTHPALPGAPYLLAALLCASALALFLGVTRTLRTGDATPGDATPGDATPGDAASAGGRQHQSRRIAPAGREAQSRAASDG